MKTIIKSNVLTSLSRRGFIKLSGGAAIFWNDIQANAKEPETSLKVYDDFSEQNWPSDRWFKFRTSQYDLWDPKAVVSINEENNGVFSIDLQRFSVSHPNHVKALMLSTHTFDMDGHDVFTVRADMKVRTFSTEKNPYDLDAGDVRLASGALVVIDPDTGMVFDFFVSNDRIQPLYERLPSARGQLGNYPAFTILGPSIPTKIDEWHKFEIRYISSKNIVEWYVDGILLAKQNRVGAAPGQSGPIVKLRRPRIGGGLFTLLDDLNNEKLLVEDNPKIPGYISSNWEDRFGQGARVSFRNIEYGLAK